MNSKYIYFKSVLDIHMISHSANLNLKKNYAYTPAFYLGTLRPQLTIKDFRPLSDCNLCVKKKNPPQTPCALASAAHGFVRSVGQLPEDAPQRVQLPGQVLHSAPEPLVVRAQLHHLLLRLQITHLGLVPAFTHGHVVPLAPQPVLRAALVHVLFGLAPVQHLVVVVVAVVVSVMRARHRGGRRRGVPRLEMHGGLSAVSDLVLEVRHLLLLLLLLGLLRVPGVLLRVVVGGGHAVGQIVVVARLLLNGHGPDARLVHRFQLGVHVSRHVELLLGRSWPALHRLVLPVHRL